MLALVLQTLHSTRSTRTAETQGVALVLPDVAETLPDDGLWVWTHPCWFLLTGFGESMKGKHQRKLKIRQFSSRTRLGL